MFDSAERKIRKARSALLRGKPLGRGSFFGALAMRLDLQAAPQMKVPMATNGRMLRYHPDAVNAMSAEHLLALVAHETVHAASGHHVRRGNRDPELWNIAADHITNAELIEAGFDVPPEGQPDPRFAGMAVERVYTILEAEQPPPSSGDGKQDKPQKRKGKGKGGGTPQRWAGDVEDMPGEGDKPESDDKQDGEGNGDQTDGQAPSREEMEREMRDWQMAAAQAAAACRERGDLPAFAERFVTALHRPKQNPWERLREFVRERLNSDFRWSPPSRRFISQGLYLPSIYSEDQLGEIVIAIDTSGSIDEKTLNEFAKHCYAIQQDFRPSKIHVVWCDAKVHSVDVFEAEDPLVLKPRGGGGTDFRPVFKWIGKHMEEAPIACLYLTDGYGPFGDHAPSDYPVLWAMTTDVVAPWGETISITVD